ncbi:hypothetical protein Lal_00043541 [Lupinus albus]|nr:hypothetical protein Lal_00043542 [Lupinus albus]KAF1887139.1 hypothetical protein Lal_00043541 [Lupinus albus]
MNTFNPQSKELFGLVEIKVASAASNSLLGHNDPFYAPEEQTARLAKFAGRGFTPTAYTNLSWMTDSGFMFPKFLKNYGLQVLVEMHGKMYQSLIREFYRNFKCKNGVYQTMVKNIFIILDEDILVDVGGLGRFDHPYGYFEEKLLSEFEPLRTYRTMLRDSQRHQATNKPFVSALAEEYKLMYTLLVTAKLHLTNYSSECDSAFSDCQNG